MAPEGKRASHQYEPGRFEGPGRRVAGPSRTRLCARPGQGLRLRSPDPACRSRAKGSCGTSLDERALAIAARASHPRARRFASRRSPAAHVAPLARARRLPLRDRAGPFRGTRSLGRIAWLRGEPRPDDRHGNAGSTNAERRCGKCRRECRADRHHGRASRGCDPRLHAARRPSRGLSRARRRDRRRQATQNSRSGSKAIRRPSTRGCG